MSIQHDYIHSYKLQKEHRGDGFFSKSMKFFVEK